MQETGSPKYAYDIEVHKSSVRDEGPRGHGWCFGLPPGISPEQWPLDAHSGYPLQHGFTILLPEDYRVHGPELVALSFFGVAFGHFEEVVEEISDLFRSFPDGTPPSDPDLQVFWAAESHRHQRMHRMEDILGGSYAVLLLTQEEFEGPFCLPPRLRANRYRDRIAPPAWMTVGAAGHFWKHEQTALLAPEETLYFKLFGEAPTRSVSYNRALSWRPRANDPNVWIAPRDPFFEPETGYQHHIYEDGEDFFEHEWARDYELNHIGGTMRPIQNVPSFSPFYIEFEDYLGGFNFGDGNAQLDFKDMKFDWSQ